MSLNLDRTLYREVIEKSLLLKTRNAIEVDLGFSEEDLEILCAIRVERNLDQFSAFGLPRAHLRSDLERYLRHMGDNRSSHTWYLADLVSRLSYGVQEGLSKDSAWVLLRVSLPTPEFDIPRWHSDGSYYTSSAPVLKFVTTLKGDFTLFGEVRDSERFKALQDEEMRAWSYYQSDRPAFDREMMRIRRELAGIVDRQDIGDVGKGVLYRVGDSAAAFHSEPPIRFPRIFHSVLPGSRAQIEEWRVRGSTRE